MTDVLGFVENRSIVKVATAKISFQLLEGKEGYDPCLQKQLTVAASASALECVAERLQAGLEEVIHHHAIIRK